MIRWVQAADRKAELSVFDSRSDQNDERKPDGPPEFRIGLLDSAMRTSGRDEQNDPARDERRLQEILSRCKCDYLVLPFNGNRQTLTLNGRMAHHPGGIQGLSPFQTGPHGCTLVEIDPSRTAMNCSFIPTAPVRYERLTVEVNEETVRDDLMQQMTAALDGLRPAPTESVWLVEWTIRGNGPIAETIQQRALLQELIKLPELSAPFSGGPSLHHSFRIRLNDDASCRDAPLTAEFAKMVDRLPEVTAATLADLLAGVQLPEEPWGRRLRSQIGVLDQRAVESHVRRLGRLLIGRAGKDECR
jgi:hypothetical protein